MEKQTTKVAIENHDYLNVFLSNYEVAWLTDSRGDLDIYGEDCHHAHEDSSLDTDNWHRVENDRNCVIVIEPRTKHVDVYSPSYFRKIKKRIGAAEYEHLGRGKYRLKSKV